MVQAQGSDTSDNWTRNNVHVTICPSNTYFKDCSINFFFQENMKYHQCEESKVFQHVRCGKDHSLDMMPESNSMVSGSKATHCVIGNQFIPYFEEVFGEFILREWQAIDSSPLANSHQMWRRI